jgi:uracil-DNA glycosylase
VVNEEKIDSLDADIVFNISEGLSGRNRESQVPILLEMAGIPFVGRAGQLLTLMIHAIGMKREEVYIANVLKCRPPNNRDPLPAEIEKCEPYLLKQIELITPKLIVALGRIACASSVHPRWRALDRGARRCRRPL